MFSYESEAIAALFGKGEVLIRLKVGLACYLARRRALSLVHLTVVQLF